MMKRLFMLAGIFVLSFAVFAQSVDEAGAKYNAGNDAMKEKNYAEAVTSYESALKIVNASGAEDVGLINNIKSQLMNAYSKNGLTLFKEKKYDAAVNNLEKSYDLAIAMDETDMQAKQVEYIAKIRSAKGMSLIKDNKLDEANTEFDKAHKVKPDCVISFYGKGLVYKEKGDMANMMKNMDQAISYGKKEPKMAKYVDKAKEAASVALLAEAATELTREHNQEATDLLNDSFKYGSGTADTYYYLTIAYNKTKQFENAVEAANKALGMQTGEKSSIYFELGQALEGKGDVQGACAAYKMVTSGPNVDAAQYQVGQVLQCG